MPSLKSTKKKKYSRQQAVTCCTRPATAILVLIILLVAVVYLQRTGNSISTSKYIYESSSNNSLRRSSDPVATPTAATTATTSIGGCTPLQKRLIQKQIPNADAIIAATKCPYSNTWLSDHLRNNGAERMSSFLAMYFGCNKGYDALYTARTASHNVDVFSKTKWGEALNVGHPGNCFQGAGPTDNVNVNFSSANKLGQQKKPVEVHCIEAMPQTAELVRQAAQTTTAAEHGFIVHNYAMTGTVGGNTVLFPNPQGGAGQEAFGMAHCEYPTMKAECKAVPSITIDEYVAKHVDRDGSPTSRRIPFLSVDVEGSDFTVLQAAKKTLQRTDYLEFEYHRLGDWQKQKLKDAIDMLKEVGFVCYWSGMAKLWRITDCWMDYFEFHQWSNVACVAPEHEPRLAQRMEQVFEYTLVGKKP